MISYQCVSRDGTAICFREKIPGQTIEFFAPRIGRDYWTSSYEHKLEHIRNFASLKDPNNEYPPVVHAAVYLLQYESVGGLSLKDVLPARLSWGQHFPRMWRARHIRHNPMSRCPVAPLSTYGEVYTQSVVAAESLFEEFAAIFRIVEPSNANLEAYGHRFRELAILACTEVEACLRGVLCVNTPSAQHDGWYTTKDYARLKLPMRLDEWSVKLKDYPTTPDIAPFASWNPQQATKSLPWYVAYNAIKHDREGEFHRATLRVVIEAMAAVFIMQCAQWGPEVFLPWFDNRSSVFTVTNTPRWEAGDFYAADSNNPDKWTPVLYFPDP